jgi:hypothetical protein
VPPPGGGTASAPAAPPAASAPAADSAAAPSASWGRVDESGTVFVRARDGAERAVGQWPDADSAEALQFYTRRFDGLEAEVALLERRATAAATGPEEMRAAAERLRASIQDAQAVGDLAGLLERLAALAPVLEQQREARRAERAERARRTAQACLAKEQLVAAAEQVAQGADWRAGSDRLAALLAEWKALPRLDNRTDEALWRRYSTARSAFGKRRKQHYAAQDEQRAKAQAVKERLAGAAESLATSTDWVATGRAFRDLMQEWKAAGPAPRTVDDALWRRFRTAQDQFFTARDEVNAATDAEQMANAEAKREILALAEALLPIDDPAAARTALRPLADRWEAAGRVPRDQVQSLERRMQAVVAAIEAAETERWRRSDPEAAARAADMVAQLEAGLARLATDRDAARQRGDVRAAADLEEQIHARQGWLDQARRALTDFGG